MDGQNYFASWSAGLLAKANLVRDLIGDAHWLSDGHHKEYLIKEFLKEYLPSEARISSGFIKPPRNDLSCSKELDVMIFDSTKYTPYFSQNDLSIVAPSSVIGHIESKTSFVKKELKVAIENVASSNDLVSRFGGNGDAAWSGICFFNTPCSRTLQSVANTIADTLDESVWPLVMDEPIEDRFLKMKALLPNSIFSIDKFVAFFHLSDCNTYLEIRIHQTNKLTVAVAFNDLLSHVRVWYGGSRGGDIYDLSLESFPIELDSITHKYQSE